MTAGGDEMEKEVMVLAIKNFPLDLYRKVKEQAANEHRTLRGLVLVALEEYLEKSDKKGGRSWA
jgi:hypothetical protein